jgi:predicted MarR family transcription regulator
MATAMVMELSEREKAVLDAIVAYKSAHDGCSPTLRQIGKAIDVPSTSLIKFYLEKLMLKQQIIYTGADIQVVGGKWVQP